jgi:hypothetical protein
MKARLGVPPSASGAPITPAQRPRPADCPPMGRAAFDGFRRRAALDPFMPEWVKAGLERGQVHHHASAAPCGCAGPSTIA